MKRMKAIIIGAGSRGNAYAAYAEMHPEELKITGVAEPDVHRREEMVRRHDVAPEGVFTRWEDILTQPKMADAAFICTQDAMHVEPAIAALRKGYHLLLEKPIAPTEEGCRKLLEEYRSCDRSVAVAHVLRYSPFFTALKEQLNRGEVGRIRGIQHNENVGHIHYSHSYVRGNWRRSDESSPMILAKSCHDMDILLFLTGANCLRISSFAGRGVFTAENRPEGAPDRCLDGCPYQNDCPYYAPKIYLKEDFPWPPDALTSDNTPAGVRKALQEGPYGRCVYACDNNVVEQQTVNMDFEGEIPIVFSMSAFTEKTSRTIKVVGDKGELRGHMENNEIEIFDFTTRRTTTTTLESTVSGHGGGDFSFVRDFLIHLRDRTQPLVSNLEGAVQSHRMALAAEESRKTGNVISLKTNT